MPTTVPKLSAFVTLVTNTEYGLGAAVLGQRLCDFKTKHSTVAMVTSTVSDSTRQLLSTVWDVLIDIPELNSDDATSLALMERPELGVTFSKLHVWRLTQYNKIVFLDADTMPLCNIDQLFGYSELSACPDAGWPDCFNSGLFVLTPDLQTYDGLVEKAASEGSFDGGDQGLLNSYFSSWARTDITKHIPFLYNVNPNASYTYLPAYRKFSKDVKMIHFLGAAKPWHYQSQNGVIIGSNVSQHLRAFLEQWYATLDKVLGVEAVVNVEEKVIEFQRTGGDSVVGVLSTGGDSAVGVVSTGGDCVVEVPITVGDSVVDVLSHIAEQIKDMDMEKNKSR